MSKSDAYRQAYGGTKMKPESIWCNASKLASSTKVAQWLAYLKATQITEAVYTKEQHPLDMAEAARPDTDYHWTGDLQVIWLSVR